MFRFSLQRYVREFAKRHWGWSASRASGQCRRRSRSGSQPARAALVERLEPRTLLSAATVTSVATSGVGITAGTGDLGVGQAATLTVNFSAAVTVNTAGGSPTLSLNDGGTAVYTGGSGNTGLTFAYTVAAGQNTSDLAVTALNLNGSTIRNNGTNIDPSGAVTNPAGILQIDTASPYVVSINRTTPSVATTSATSVSFTATFNEPVTGVDASDFQVVTTGGVSDFQVVTMNGVANSGVQVTPVSSSVYTVTVSEFASTGTGTLGLNLVNNGSIHDTVGNSLGASGLFQPQATYAVGNDPTSIATANLTGDGIQDLVVTNAGDDTVSVLMGRGDGTFLPQQTYNVGVDPTSVTIADVNGDGKPDLIVTNNDQNGATVGVLLGNGDGTFQTQQIFEVAGNVNSVVVADLNGDGKPDVVVTHYQSVGVLLGNGNGTFQSEQTFATGVSSVSVAVGDLNGDGRPDLVVASDSASLPFNQPATVSVLLGNGDGTFQSQQTYAVGNSFDLPTSVAIGDVNKDGKPDLVVANISNTVSVLLGNGDGTFQPQQMFSTGQNRPSSVAVKDVNGDGFPDLVVTNEFGTSVDDPHVGSVSVLLGKGNDTFQSPQSFSVGPDPTSTKLVDLNGDGSLDAVVANGGSYNYGGSSVSVLLNDANGNFAGQVYTLIPSSQEFLPTAVGAETRVNTYTTDAQTKPVIAMDAAGDYVVAWQSFGQDGSGWGIFAQQYNANGTPKGAEFQVNLTDTAGIQAFPAVAMDPAGDFVIAWQDSPAGGTSGYDIFARRYNAAGVAQGSDFLVNTYTTGGQTKPSVAMDQSGDFVVVWSSYSQFAPDEYSAYAQRYTATGATVGSEFRVGDSGGAQPSVAMDAAGDFVIDYGSQAELYNSSGAAVKSLDTHLVASDGTVAMDAAGDFVIVSSRYYDGGAFTPQYRIVAQRYDSAGDVQGNLIVGNPAGGHATGSYYRVAMDHTGEFVVTWQSAGQDGSRYGIYAQAYNPAGVATGSEFQVNTFTVSTQNEPAIAMDAAGDFVIAWQSNGNQDGNSYGVYAQRYANVIDHAPVGTSGSVSTLENVAYVFKATDFGFTDPNDNPPNSLMAVEITTLPVAGTLTDNGTAVTAQQFISVADINSGKLVFTPAANASGTAYASFTFQVQDNGSTLNGGVNLDPTPKTMTINVTPLTAPVIATNPTNQSVNAGQTVTFTAAASGNPAPTVVWQISTNGGTTFANIPGATSKTLNFTTTAAQNNDQFRAIFTNSQGSATTTVATLAVAGAAAPGVTLAPTSQSVASGHTVTFTAAASGNPTPTVVWQISTNGGTTFSNIPGATSTTLNFTTNAGENGNLFRAVFSNSHGTVATTAATLTVIGAAAPVVTTNPTNQNAIAGKVVTFTAGASGDPTPTVQWQISTDGGTTFKNIAGGNSATLNFTTTTAQNNDQFRAVFTNSQGTATTSIATLTVAAAVPPTVTTNPTNQTVAAGHPVTFVAAATGSTSVQWQISTDGGTTFKNISGASSATLNFTTTLAENGDKFRAVFTNAQGTATTTVASLTVTGAVAPTITVNPSSQIVTSGNTVTFTAAATGNPAPSVIWQISTDGGTTFANIPGATSATLNFTTKLSQNGDQFRAVFTNSSGSATTVAATMTVTLLPVAL